MSRYYYTKLCVAFVQSSVRLCGTCGSCCVPVIVTQRVRYSHFVDVDAVDKNSSQWLLSFGKLANRSWVRVLLELFSD